MSGFTTNKSPFTTNQKHTFFNHTGTLFSELEWVRPELEALGWDGLLLESRELLDSKEMYSAWSSSWEGRREQGLFVKTNKVFTVLTDRGHKQ